MNYYGSSTSEVLDAVDSSRNGLSPEEAAKRLETGGRNELSEKKKKGVLRVFFGQFADLLVIILIISAAISAFTGNLDSTLVILCVITMNAVLGTVQHFKAQKSLDSLKAMSSPSARVIRGGETIEIPAAEVTVGDILLIEAGSIAAADGRVIEAALLTADESSLTGESENVVKTSKVIEGENVPLGDRKNMIYSGSLITAGRGVLVVTAIGMDTEIGKIANLLENSAEKKTPLQVSLDSFGKKLSAGILIICAVVMGLSVLRGTGIVDSLMFAVALAVAAIPEALSSIVTISLAIGTSKMAKEHAVVKNLKAVEGLGCVSVICSDKTGTLTQNKMTVRKMFIDGRVYNEGEFPCNTESSQRLLVAMVLCNDAVCGLGDPTETALLDCYGKDCCEEQRREYPRISEIPFDSDRKLMSTLHNFDGNNIMLTKGAVDNILPNITRVYENGEERDVSPEDTAKIKAANSEFSENGMRVLAFVMKNVGDKKKIRFDDENDFTFIGLCAMTDPPREESKAAVAECINAGIRPVMITGDHKITATAIAREIGIFRDGDIALTGAELDAMTDDEISEKLDKVSVYARVSPENKIRIVDLWQRRGEIVSMTGDGVNDAPALKKADVGVAMGITGTEVSKDAASMILADDNFATIVKAVENGRNIYSNIKNSIKFLLSGNLAGIITVLYTVLLGLPLPFTAVHLLFINLLTDSLPAIAISMEKGTGDIMKEKPRKSGESILNADMIRSVTSQGLLLAAATVTAFYLGLQTSPEAASTMAFATLCLSRLFGSFNCRSKRSIFRIPVNMQCIGAFVIGAVFLSCAMFIPPLQALFDVTPLTPVMVGLCTLLAFLPTFFIQLFKLIFRK